MTFYEGAAIVPPGHVVLHRDGRRATQVRRAFLAPSVAAAIRVINQYGYNRRFIKEYVNVEDDIPRGLSFLADHPPGTVFIAPMDPGDTIDGTHGWRPA